MKVNRQDLLNQLEMVSPGLSKRDIIEQSSCFVFKDKHIITYNDEIACSHPTDLNIEGAVVSNELLQLLRKLQHEELDFRTKDGKLLVLRKNGRSHIRMEEEILLPYESVDRPKKWKKLPEDFLEAIKIVKACASTDQSQFALTCLLFKPDAIDACDRFQACRYKMDLPIKKNFLIRRESIGHLTTMSIAYISETKDWIHFKNDSGLIISCRRYNNVEDFFPIDKIVEIKGKKLVMPKGLKEAVETTDIFTEDNDSRVTIKLKPNRISLKGIGINGGNEEVRKAKYTGKELIFTITANLLIEFTDKFSKCFVTPKKLCVKDHKFLYSTSLGKPK